MSTLGSLSNDDGDDNENGKKAMGLDKREWARSLSLGLDWQNNNFACISRFFLHFFAVAALLQRESASLHVLSRTWTKTTTFFFFSLTSIQSFRIQLQKNLPTFNELNELKQAR